MPRRETTPPVRDMSALVEAMGHHFDSLIEENLSGLYSTAYPQGVRDQPVSSFEIAEGDEVAEANLMKVWFTAHARAHAQNSHLKVAPFVRNEPGQLYIRRAHVRLGILEPPRFFRIVPGDQAHSPYHRMLSRLQTADGAPVTKAIQNACHAAQIAVGEVVLADPAYSAQHPNPVFREQIAAALLR